MNENEPIQKIFRPFREAKAPSGFTDRVMARLGEEETPARSWVRILGLSGAPGRWAWAGGLAVAASVALMIPHPQTPQPLGKVDVSIYLADSNQIEEEADLGTQIESYFL